MSRKAVIVSACRTPIGSLMGSLSSFSSAELGTAVVKEAINRAGIAAKQVDEVFMGCVLQAGAGQNLARQAAVGAGIPVEVPAMTLNIVCGSGLRAVSLAAQTILNGDNDIVVAGGSESMSNAPYYLKNMRAGNRLGDVSSQDSILKDALTDAFTNIHMGITAENLAEKYGISRETQDEFAVESQLRAERAITKGLFKDEIIPLKSKDRKGTELIIDTDEYPRFGATKEKLAKLHPAFKKDGTVTAGNASGINDGAAAFVVMSEEKAIELGIKPLVYITSYACAGVEPKIMGIGPVPAVKKALEKAGLEIHEIDLIEANEAFAAQALSVMKELKLGPEKVNVNGGAIALGHPVGASGARIAVSLIYEMKRRDANRGLATLCIGGGMGVCVVFEKY